MGGDVVVLLHARKYDFPLTLFLHRQCFGEFHVVVDLPHGGKTYGDGKLKGPRYLPVRNLTMTLDDIERTVRDNIGDAVRLLDTHCSARVHVAVEMLNHSTLGPWLERHFDFSGPAVNSSDIPFNDTRPDLPIIQRFFMNTVMYAHAIIATETRYILHTDVDTIGLWNSPPTWASYYEPTFVRRAIDAFEDNTTVVFARPAEQCYSTSVKPVHLDSGMSCRLFISAPSRFQRMVPFQYWAAHVEDMIVTNMAMHNMSAVIIGQSRPCWTDTWFQRKVLRDHNWS